MLNNPFVTAGYIPEEYFCDRNEETEKLIKYLYNNNNIVLISPRRMGKSGLILHTFSRKEMKENFATIYIDILQTSSLKEFVFILGKAVFDNLVPKTTKFITSFFQSLKSLSGKITFDAITGLPSFNVMLGEITNPQLTLDEIFQYIEKVDKRVVVAIDEFQQIIKYPEKNIEAMLRTYIQQCGNANFIFSGSERHIMQEIFLSHARPFYNSAGVMILEAIPKAIYLKFAEDNFQKDGRKVDYKALESLYDLFEGYTFYLQKTLNMAYADQRPGEVCDEELINKSINNILEANSVIYREVLSNMPERQKELFYALALEKNNIELTSSAFIRKYNLLSASSVQSASKSLLEKEYITRSGKKYELNDKFFALWIRKIYG